MQDRHAQNPGRFLITPEDGSPAYYAIITMADDADIPGTPLNKATFLPDPTEIAIFGDAKNRTVSDVFIKMLAEIDTAKHSTSIGSYTGTGTHRRKISLPFTPRAVLVMSVTGCMAGSSSYEGGMAITGVNATAYSSSGVIDWDDTYSTVAVDDHGFLVNYHKGSYISPYTNFKGDMYVYIAFP